MNLNEIEKGYEEIRMQNDEGEREESTLLFSITLKADTRHPKYDIYLGMNKRLNWCLHSD